MIKVINIEFDTEASVYIIASSDIPGLFLESESCEKLMNRCVLAVPELLELYDEKPDESITLRFTIDCKL